MVDDLAKRRIQLELKLLIYRVMISQSLCPLWSRMLEKRTVTSSDPQAGNLPKQMTSEYIKNLLVKYHLQSIAATKHYM
jgi:hypothetical protein